jgi:hypothetical protein
MAKPRVFVSSTYYDLKHLRSAIEAFIDSLGYEPILSGERFNRIFTRPATGRIVLPRSEKYRHIRSDHWGEVWI